MIKNQRASTKRPLNYARRQSMFSEIELHVYEKIGPKRTLLDANTIRLNGIKFPSLYFLSRCDLTIFSSALKGQHMFGDLDGIITIAGNNLALETKLRKGPLSMGQARMFATLAMVNNTTTFVMAGPVNKPEYIKVFSPDRPYGTGWKKTDLRAIGKMIREWEAFANANPKILDITALEEAILLD